nr:uncharacterized protein LOC106680097 [Halyomorpha halys]
MNRLVISLWIIFISTKYTNATFEDEMFETINRIGEDARKANTANLRKTLQETLLAGSNPEQWSCVYSQISPSYKELHTSLNMVLEDLRAELGNNNPVLMLIPQEKVKGLIEHSVEQATAAFNVRLSQIRECVPQ